MTTGFGVLRCVPVRRAIAAQSYAALLAGSQMNPGGRGFNAFRALESLRTLYRLDRLDVVA